MYYFLISYLLFLVIINLLNLNNLYYLQSFGYSVKELLRVGYVKLKSNLLNWIMVLLIVITMIYLHITNEIFLLCYLILECIVIVLSCDFSYIRKLKFTKRIIRLICFYSLISIGSGFFLLFVIDYFFFVVLFPMVFLLGIFLLVLSYYVLVPIEKLIGNHYINKSKKILRENVKLIKIGITGSFGKTSVKEILNSILSECYRSLVTPKSFNTPFGITKTIISSLNQSYEIFVSEMGAKKKGEIKELCNLVEVDMGIVTAVGRQHTNTFGNIENIYNTKKELPNYLNGKPCVFNLMNCYTNMMYKEYSGIKVGVFLIEKKNVLLKNRYLFKKQFLKHSILPTKKFYEYLKFGNVYAKNICLNVNGAIFDAWFGNEFIGKIKSNLLGLHNVINILLAIALAKCLCVPNNKILSGVSKLSKISARYEKCFNNNGAVIINNGYNSNLDSARYSLKTLSIFNKSNIVVITPGLIECEDNYKYNFEFGKLLAKFCTDVVVVKQVNKEAITKGLLECGFNKDKITYVSNFSDCNDFLKSAGDDYVILIENDLPDNFK